MRAVVTVTGKDNKGIIAKITSFLADKGVNIEDISQTILSDYFAMIMIADVSEVQQELASLARECAEFGRQIGMSVYLQHEDIFNAMHNV